MKWSAWYQFDSKKWHERSQSQSLLTNGIKYSGMDQVKFVEDSL